MHCSLWNHIHSSVKMSNRAMSTELNKHRTFECSNLHVYAPMDVYCNKGNKEEFYYCMHLYAFMHGLYETFYSGSFCQ